MKKCEFSQARFLLATLDEVPPFLDKHHNVLPEIALVGRSNVGKSSLINHLLHQKKLAKVSGQPGKTQTINYFNVDDCLILVDLPGYGFASRSQKMQETWSAAIDTYFEKRTSLTLIILLIDSRRLPSEEDLAIIQWAQHRKKPLLLVWTKSDTIKQSESKNKEKGSKIASHYLHYSIKDARARQKLISTINLMLSQPPLLEGRSLKGN